MLGLTVLGGDFANAQSAPPEVYSRHCAVCHGADRLGGMGPALLPENLRRLRKKAASGVIANGRVATQMPAFGDTLTEFEIAQLVELVYTPLAEIPRWGAEQIRASHLLHNRLEDLPDTPRFSADPLNLFIVVELGDHHVTILDGDSFEPIHRFKTRFALHGGPKYSPDGRFVYFASRDGWITKYDIYNLKPVAEIRAGINTRNLAVSEDGRYVMVGNYLPHTLVALDARDLTPLAVIPVEDGDGRSSRISAVYAAPPRHTFVAALKDIPEIWELSYSDPPPPGFSALADGHALSRGPGFSLRRIALREVLDDFFFDQDYVLVIGASRDGSGQVVNLDSGQSAGAIDLPGLPHLGSGITWNYQGRTVLATPNLKEGVVSVIDLQSRQTIKRIETLGPGFFMRSHEASRYAWVDVFFGPHRDAVHVIDKSKLEIVKTLTPAPGKTSAHVEFTRDGRYALLSIWDMDGAVVVYDARTLEEVKRIPMKKPSGKYNVYNKITRSRGTSH
jgi:WD40 repeat protein